MKRCFTLPPAILARAAALHEVGPLPPAAVRVEVSDLPATLGAQAFAADGGIWITPRAFAPNTPKGLALIGHELAHLA